MNLVNIFQGSRGNKNSLKDSIISQLAGEIATQKMTQIAAEFLDFTFDQLESMEGSCRGDMWKYNVKILATWRNLTLNNNREVSTFLQERLKLFFSEGNFLY